MVQENIEEEAGKNDNNDDKILPTKFNAHHRNCHKQHMQHH